MTVRGHGQSDEKAPLVVIIGVPGNHDYRRRVRHAADGRDRFLWAVWDQALFGEMCAWSTSYLHGRSVCGMNPSPLCAMGDGAEVLEVDVFFNRQPADGHVFFLTVPDALARFVVQVEDDPGEGEAKSEGRRCSVSTTYRWGNGATKYERLAQELSAGAGRRRLM